MEVVPRFRAVMPREMLLGHVKNHDARTDVIEVATSLSLLVAMDAGKRFCVLVHSAPCEKEDLRIAGLAPEKVRDAAVREAEERWAAKKSRQKEAGKGQMGREREYHTVRAGDVTMMTGSKPYIVFNPLTYRAAILEGHPPVIEYIMMEFRSDKVTSPGGKRTVWRKRVDGEPHGCALIDWMMSKILEFSVMACHRTLDDIFFS